LLACYSGQGFFVKMTLTEKYQKERQKLELNRSLDWSSFGVQYIVAGERINPLTVGTWFDLMIVKSPIITQDEITVESIVDYIWRNSPRRTTNTLLKEWRLFWLQRRVEKDLRKEETALSLIRVLKEHVKSAFDEVPESKAMLKDAHSNRMLDVAGEVAMVDEIANRYAMPPRDVLAMPLRQAFSLQRAIRVVSIPDYHLLEPASLRAIKSEYLKEINNHVERN